MRTEEIKETKVVGTKYIADDGTEFYSVEDCKKYEQSALFVMRSKLKFIADTDQEEFSVDGCCDNGVEKAYLHLVLSIHGVRNFDSYFDDSEYSFGNATVGHEVIIWWNYDQDHFWIYGDGGIYAYLEYAKQRAFKAIDRYKANKEKKEEKGE